MRPMYRVELRGDFDYAQKAALEGLVDDFRASGCHDVVIGLQGVKFADSTWVDAMIALSEVASQRGGRVELRAAPSMCLRLLDLLGLRDHFCLTTSPRADAGSVSRLCSPDPGTETRRSVPHR